MKKPNWFKFVSNRHSLLYNYGARIALRDLIPKNTGLNIKLLNLKSITGISYLDKDEFATFTKKIEEYADEDLNNLNKLAEKCKKQGEKLLKLSLEFNKKEFNKSSLTKLRDFFKTFTEEYIDMQAFLTITNAIDIIITEKVKTILKNKTNNFEEHFPRIATPNKNSFNKLEQFDLLKIACEIKKKNYDLDNLPSNILISLKNHSNKYGWINCRHFLGEPWNIDYFITRLKNLTKEDVNLKLEELKQQSEQNEIELNKVINGLKLNQEEIKSINILREYVFLRNYRKDVLNLSGFYARPLLKEIGKRINLDYHKLINLTSEEILNVLNAHTNAEERKNGFTLTMMGGKVDIQNKEVFEEEQVEDVKEIKGNSANKGFVKGKVRLLKNKDDISKVEKGDILVAAMTTPDYVIAMEKAAAIITDMGGITCHAAVISREMNIPCVIGTKIATSIFKDGDLVEVDANKGIVRKIE